MQPLQVFRILSIIALAAAVSGQTISTFAGGGTATPPTSGSVAATSVSLSPNSLAADQFGRVYIDANSYIVDTRGQLSRLPKSLDVS